MTQLSKRDWENVTRIGVSAFVMLLAGVIILSNSYPDSHLKWAFGVVGIILGYWLK